MNEIAIGVLVVAGIFAVVMVAGGPYCTLRPCRWVWHCNVVLEDDAPCGLYQCSRCKTLSIGAGRAT